MKQKKILLVDDTIPLLEELSSILEMEGYDVRSFFSAPDALDSLKQHEPDIIITDIVMPKMSGIEFISHLRSQEKYKTKPIIVLTADNTLLKSDNLDKFNIHALLSKPCSVDKLLEVIENTTNG
ncbi:MAG: response regulator [Candidatus Cyclobacteriaceae bacterium M2_1C_046]